MTDIQDIPLKTITGDATSLGAFAGQVLLVVNVASKCGLTPQYEALEALHERLHDQGFSVLGFPANDFRDQEPGTEEEIAEFCRATYGVTFPMFSKTVVTGDDKHPLYAQLTGAISPGAGDREAHRQRLTGFGIATTDDPEVLWNFEKFLISKDGEIVGRFAPTITPEDEVLTDAVERELTK